jgi:predicted MFS family arabinose efflux permease
MTIVAALAPPRERGKYQAALGIVPAIAVVCGPLIGGLIVEHMGWWWIFLVNLPIGLVAMALVAIHLNVSEAPHAAHHARHRAGLSASLVAPNIFWSSAVLFMSATAVLFVGMLYIPLTLQDVYALSPATAGASIIPMLFGLVAASGIAGTVVARTGRYRAIPMVGTICMGMSLGWLTAMPGSPSPTLIICAGTTLGVGVGLVIQSALLAGQNAVAERHLDLGTGILNFFKTIGGALGASAAVLVRLVLPAESASLFQSYRFCFGAGLVAAVAGIVVALLLRERPLSATMTEVVSGATEAPEF